MTNTNEQLTAKYTTFTEPGQPLHGLFTVVRVDACDYQVDGISHGHPFTIGPEHVAEASDHYGGQLTQEVIEKIPCAHQNTRHGKKCGRPYHTHTHKLALFVNLVRNLGNKEAGSALFAIKEEMEKDKISGVAILNFRGRPGDFAIQPAEKEQAKDKG